MIKEEKIFKYIFNNPKPFTINQLAKALKFENTKSNKKFIDKILYSSDDIVYHNKKYYPKIIFLPKFKIRIQITEFELSHKILILGHRILPFCPSHQNIADIELFYNSVRVNKFVTTFNINDIYMYISLLDVYRMPILNPLTSKSKNANIHVYDLRDFCMENNFKINDTIILETKDFNNAEFTIRYESREDLNNNIFFIKKNDALFLKNLRHVLKEKLLFANSEKQLLATYLRLFYSKEEIQGTMPGTALGPLIIKSGDIMFSTLENGKTVLHFKNQNTDDLDMYPDFDEIDVDDHMGDINLTTADGILRYTGNSNNENVLRGLIYHLTTTGQYSIENVNDYIFKNNNFPLSEELQEQFNRNITDIYKEIQNLLMNYNPSQNEIDLRKKILDISLEISLFIRELDSYSIDPAELPKNDMYKLVELQNLLEGTLPLMESNEEQDADGLRSLLNGINQMENTVKAIINNIKIKIFNN